MSKHQDLQKILFEEIVFDNDFRKIKKIQDTYVHTHAHTHSHIFEDRQWSWKTLKTKWARFCAKIYVAKGKTATLERCNMLSRSH